MIPIREHNDIVQKLMKEITSKDQELKSMAKEKTKGPSQAPQLQPTKNEQLLNKKITQLTKQHKERVSTLNQQIRNKSLQNKDLKERLITKQNLQAKEKEHISEILKKTYDRKPSSGADYKISTLVSHYEAQIDKKAKYIESLQKQIKELSLASSKDTMVSSTENENYKIVNQNEGPKGISLVEHQKELNRLKIDMQKYKKLFEEKDKQYRDLSRRYSQLTKEYYQIINSYGLEDKKEKAKPLSCVKSEQNIKFPPSKKKEKAQRGHALQKLLHQMAGSESQMEETALNRRAFSSKVANIESGKYPLQQRELYDSPQSEPEHLLLSEQTSPDQTSACMRIDQIMDFLGLEDPSQIIPRLIKIKTSLQEFTVIDTVARSLQVFFCNIGKGKLTKDQLVEALEDLQIAYNKNLEAVDILDELCILAGAKRQKLSEKVRELIHTSEQYYGKLKSLRFVQDMAKGNKVLQFIEFFELQKEELVLPQQLAKIQEQLKSINKFVKEARMILQIGSDNSSQQVLQLVLRYLQKTTSLVSQLQRKKVKPRQ